MPPSTVAIAADHAGVELKNMLKAQIATMGWKVLDLGTNGPESVDYPDFADAVAKALASGIASRGVLVCGTGNGMAIAANRHRHVRAALCADETSARLARQHNDANVLALGARIVGTEVAKDCLKMFLATPFDGGRHAPRVAKLG
jgi:ribose 5-phosphate isomerase B